VQKKVTGRYAWELVRDPQTSEIFSLWPLVSAALAPIPSMPGSTEWFDGYLYTTPTGNRPLTNDQVFYAWQPSITDWRMPESVLQAASLPIAIQVEVDRYMHNLLKNGMAAKKMVITPPFEIAEDARAFEEQFLSEFSGVNSAGSTIFAQAENDYDQATGKLVDQANVQVIDLATSPVDAQLLALIQEAKNDICVVPGTIIVTKRGTIPVEDVMVGDEVVTHRGRWRKVTTTMVNAPSAPLVELTANGLDPLRLTSNHPVRVARYDKTHGDTSYQFKGVDWVPAGDLLARGRQRRSSHALTIPVMDIPDETGVLDVAALHVLGRRGGHTLDRDGATLHSSSRAHDIPADLKLSPALGRLLGLYLAEGSCNGHQVTWALHEDETDLQQQIIDDCMEVFGLPAGIYPAAEGKCVSVRMHSTLAVPVFRCGTARTKQLPDWAWRGDEAFLSEVLWGWIAGDGSVDERNTRGFTSSQSLAWHMRLIAISLGHRASLQHMVQTPSVIYGRDVPGGGDGWIVAWSHHEAQAGHGTIYRLEDEVLTSPLRESTSVDYDGLVYNLSVDEDESYLTSGGMVHNCIALGVPRSLIGDASQRIYANADAEYRNFWTLTLLNEIRDLQDSINVNLAPQIGSEVGWFDLSKVNALQPPQITTQPTVQDLLSLGVTPDQITDLLAIPDANASDYSDTSTVESGEEAIKSGGSRSVAFNRAIERHRSTVFNTYGMDKMAAEPIRERIVVQTRAKHPIVQAPELVGTLNALTSGIRAKHGKRSADILAIKGFDKWLEEMTPELLAAVGS
jgi:hypothetical protein